MTDHTYLLAIDATTPLSDVERIAEFVSTSNDFSSWWNHIPMLFMVESQMDASAIADKLHAMAPNAKFLLTQVNLADAQGWLPEVSWKWIEKRALAPTSQNSSRF